MGGPFFNVQPLGARSSFSSCPVLMPDTQSVLTVVGAVYGGVNLSWRHVMEMFFIVLALVAGAGIVFFLFVIEPRRKIYDYDPSDYDPRGPR
jgi:hypothetical protein